MVQQKKFLLEWDFDAYSDIILRIVIQNTINYHNAVDIAQKVFIRSTKKRQVVRDKNHKKVRLVRFTFNFCHDLNRFTIIRQRVLLHICTRVAKAYTKTARQETQRVLPFYYKRTLIDKIAEIIGKSFWTIDSNLHRVRKMLRLDFEDLEVY